MLKSLFFAAKLQKSPSGWGLRSQASSTVTKYLMTMPVCDTLELHQFVQQGGQFRQLCKKKTTFGSTLFAKSIFYEQILVPPHFWLVPLHFVYSGNGTGNKTFVGFAQLKIEVCFNLPVGKFTP